MTSTPGGSDRKLRQLDDDVHAIYEMVTGISEEQAQLKRQIATVETGLKIRIGQLGASLNVRMNSIEERIEERDARFDSIDTRLGSLETSMAEVLRRLPEVS